MRVQNEPPSVLPPMFPSYRRRYLRVPPEYAYKCILYILTEDLEIKADEIQHLDNFALRTNLGGKIGAYLTVRIDQEGDISVLNLSFKYRNILILAASLFAAAVVSSILFSTPLPMLSIAVFLPFAYQVNLGVIRFLDILNEALPFLEREYARQALLKDRERWKKRREKIPALYEKLRKKHIETWGNTKVLKYKIEEYQSMGLTYEEAIVKIAEEEGIITS